MESGNFLIEEKEKSPSQEDTAHLQNMKRDVESLEDFEEITKDEPSLKDLTAQFLQFETSGKPEKSFKDDFNFQRDQFDPEGEDKERPSMNFSHEDMERSPKEYESQFDPLREPNEVGNSGIDINISSKDLLNFGDNNFQSTLEGDTMEQSAEKPVVNTLDENKLSDVISNDEISTGSDDLSFIPEKGDSSPMASSLLEKEIPKKPLPESRENEMTDTFNIKQFSKFSSESATNRGEELQALQGDGLHVKENFEMDASDDDVAPEPIPKDYPEIGVIEGKQFLAAIGLDTWFQPGQLNPKVESLIYWRDPKKSGIVFGSVLVILLSLTTFSLISVVAHTSLLVLVAALAFRIYKSVLQAVQKTSEGHPFKTYLDAVVNHPIISTVFLTIEEYLDLDLTLNPEKAREVSDVVISQVNKSLTKCRSLFLVEDVIDSVKFAILLWCLTYVGAWFNGLSLLIIAFVGLFTLPKVYENNKTQIDANVDIVKSKINDVSEKIRAVIPLGKKTEEVKDKGE